MIVAPRSFVYNSSLNVWAVGYIEEAIKQSLLTFTFFGYVDFSELDQIICLCF